MARYVNTKAIRQRLEGKVRFAPEETSGDCDANEMSPQLFSSLINEAETQLEIDLMIRYETPFQETQSGQFAKLPEGTKIFLVTIAELLCCIRILETDFGRGTAANGDKYTEKLQKRYEAMVKQLIATKESESKSYQTWTLPPLAGLKLAYSNQGDTGFRGRVFNTSSVHRDPAAYAAGQINNPGEGFFNGLTGWEQDLR